MKLLGKTAIVTGASSGIGEATARLFAAEGANVVLGARRDDRLADIARGITASGGAATWVAGDVREERYCAALVEHACTEFGGLDIAMNNAGIVGEASAITDLDEPAWHDVIDTNLTSAFLCAKHQIPEILRRGGGSLVFTSSFVGHTIGLPGMAAYAASKAGLIGLTQCLAAEHGAEGVRVNALLPGGTKTEMAGEDAGHHDWVSGLHALQRMADPSEIARAALFLACEDSSFVTGSAMLVDGGNSIYKS